MNRVNERLSMNDPRHYQETHDFCQETKKKSKSRNLLQQRLDETIGKSIKEEKQRKIPSPFFLKEESLTDQEASLEETEKDSKFVWENDLEIKELETAYKEESAEKRYRRLTQGVNLLIILLCIYTGFLIFGVAVTQKNYLFPISEKKKSMKKYSHNILIYVLSINLFYCLTTNMIRMQMSI